VKNWEFFYFFSRALFRGRAKNTIYVVSVPAPRKRLLFGSKRRAGWLESCFYLYFRRLQKAAENMSFFLSRTAQVEKLGY